MFPADHELAAGAWALPYKRIRASYVLIWSSEHPIHTLAQKFIDFTLQNSF